MMRHACSILFHFFAILLVRPLSWGVLNFSMTKLHPGLSGTLPPPTST